jgi:membrane dipeptidase
MKVIDAHCDVLNKLMFQPDIDFHNTEHLDVTLERLVEVGSVLQLFAVYLSIRITNPEFHWVLKCIDLFHSLILSHPQMLHIKSAADLRRASKEGRIGAMLTLEGVDGLMGNELYLRTVYHLGVRCIGITWNYGNWAADGVKEPRQGGFTLKGRQFVQQCNELGILLDVSHLTERGFWELAEMSERPFIASHSNVYDITPNPRNLRKEQIETILQRNGRIGLTFVPPLVNADGPAVMTDLLRHIDYIGSLGGYHHMGFGSDFDGIVQWTEGLEHMGTYNKLAELLTKHYSADVVECLLYKNWYSYFESHLPQ